MSAFDFDKEVATAHFKSAGWGIDAYHHSNPFDSHMIYVRDYRTGHVQVFSVRQEHLDTLKPKLPAAELSGMVAELMSRFHQKTADNDDQMIALEVFGGYIKGTQSYRHWHSVKHKGERAHIIINIYGAVGVESWIRPFFIRDEQTVLTVDEVFHHSSTVKDMDAARHPEWFSGK